MAASEEEAVAPPAWYGDGAAYWDARYSAGHRAAEFDWLEEYGRIRHVVARCVPHLRGEGAAAEARVLHVGCGNSRLPRQMYNDGFRRIVNTDISPVVVEQMAAQHADCPGMEWRVADVTEMPDFSDESFDIVIDKGMFDTIASARDSMVEGRRAEAILLVARYLREACRVLRTGGALVCVSHAPPAGRLPFFDLPFLDFEVEAEELSAARDCMAPEAGGLEELDGVDEPNFVYTCRRNPGAAAFLARWPEVARQLAAASPSSPRAAGDEGSDDRAAAGAGGVEALADED